MVKKYAELVPHLSALHQLYGALKKARNGRGALDFDSQEVQFQFNKERKVDQINPVERNDAHKMIEECMLCANVATARFLKKLKMPALYRNHKGPQHKKLHNLQAFLSAKGLNLSGGSKPKPPHFDRLLNSLGERSDANVIRTMMQRSLSQAEYSSDSLGHFGLAYPAYAHFTSPIRRYPDLSVELESLKVEGLIHVSTLKKDFYRYDEVAQCLMGERTKKSFTVGDTVDISVSKVDMEQRKIDFQLAAAALPKKRKKSIKRNKAA